MMRRGPYSTLSFNATAMTMTEELAKFVKAHTKLTAHNPPAFGTPLVRFRVACCAHSHRRGALMS
jgi:hypothetical protein